MTKVLTILSAVTLDFIFGDPPNHRHPVVAMGRWFMLGCRKAPQQRRFLFGLGWILAGLSLFSGLTYCMLGLLSLFKQSSTPRSALEPIGLNLMFAYSNLRQAVQEVAQAIEQNDLSEARRLLGWHLVSRDTSELTEAEVIGATIESLAENLTDSLTAPLLAYALGGLPAAVAYRFINTADAMWGYRTAEFEQLGKFAARLDDGLNWLPARLTGWLLVAAAWLGGADARQASRTMLSQHGQTPSPNAGWTMSAMAGACQVTLDKRDVYQLAGGDQAITPKKLSQALIPCGFIMWLKSNCLQM